MQRTPPHFAGLAGVPTDSVGAEPIAIIGIGCRFPGAEAGPDAFWQALRDGVDAVCEVPPERWDRGIVPGDRPEVRWGSFLRAVDRFDAEFFGMSPREARKLDPQHRLLLETTWEALEDAGARPDRLMGSRTGVFVGVGTVDYLHQVVLRGPERVDVYDILGTLISTAAGRISYTFGFQGPCMTVDTACSSSAVNVHLACQSLRQGECDLAVAGAANVLISPVSVALALALQALSPDGRCKTFDASANGYVRGEGAGMVALKRLTDAQRDGDRIWALIRGSAVNQDGRSKGLTAPNGLAQQAVLREALQRAGVDPSRVGYVEAHGTGTTTGDPIEIASLKAVLGAPRADGSSCAIASVKTNIGHLEAAAGIAGLIKTALIVKHGIVPRHLHFRALHPKISLDGTPFYIPAEERPWPAQGSPRIAGVNSFGVSGTNAHIVLEEAPSAAASAEPEAPRGTAPLVLLPLSAKNPEALTALARSYEALLTKEPPDRGVQLYDIVCATSLRRSHHDERLAVVGRTREEIAGILGAWSRGEAPAGASRGTVEFMSRPKVVLVFPGQGSQWVGMGQQLLKEEPVFRAALEACDAAIARESGFSVLAELETDEAQSRLSDIDVVQPLLFAIEVALAALWRSWGVVPDAVVGHSMGEVAAAHVAGALGLADAAQIICRRSRLLRRLRGRGAMALVELPFAQAVQALAGVDDRLSVAVSNGPRSTVLSGDPQAMDEVLARLSSEGIFCRRVKVDVASHSPQMDVLRDDLRAALGGLTPTKANVPMCSTVTGEMLGGEELVDTYWVDNLRAPVLFAQAVTKLMEQGHTLFVEVSPHPILLPAIEENLRESGREGAALPSLRRHADEQRSLLESLGALYAQGCNIDLQRLYPRPGRWVQLPTYPWQRKRYWSDGERTPVGRSQASAVPEEGGHPLLGRSFSPSIYPETRFWQQTLRMDALPYLADHRVQGQIVFPAAGYLEMALAAGAGAFGTASLELEEISFVHMLVLPEGRVRQMQVVLREASPERASFEIVSHADDDEGWRTHAKGTLRPLYDTAATDVAGEPPGQTEQRCAPAAPAADHYARLARCGLEYGPAFQGLEQSWRGPQEALARVRLPDMLVAGSDAYKLHPALLDACLQAAATLLSEDTRATYVPAGIARLRFLRPMGRRGWVRARFAGDAGEGAQERTLDLAIVDEAGAILADITGLRVQRLGSAALGQQDELGQCLYTLAWRKQARPAEPPAPGAEGGAWLVFSDRGGTGAAVQSLLRSRGQQCVRVVAGKHYERIEPDLYQVCPSSPEDHRLMLQAAFDKEHACRGVVHLHGLDTATVGATTAETLDADLARGSLSALHVAQALLRQGWRDVPRLWLVTRGAQAVGEHGEVAVAQAPLWGLGRTIAAEHPELRCTLVDVGPEATAAAAATSLLSELEPLDTEDQIALRDDGRYVARIARGSFDATGLQEAQAVRVRPDGAYLITGGLGGLGRSVARWLVDQGARHVALLGRSAPSEAAVADIQAMEAEGANVLVVRADVARSDEVAQALLEIEAGPVPLRGIVHAAGVLADHTILELSEEHFARVFAPKVHGAWHLHALTRDKPLDFFVLYSSAASLFGAPGQGNYAAANAFLDALAHERRRMGVPALSINWGPFAEVGLAAAQDNRGARLELQGMGSLTAAQGVHVLERLLGKDWTQVGVFKLNLHRWLESYPAAARWPVLAELRSERAPARASTPEALRFQATLRSAQPGQRRMLLEKLLSEQLGRILRVDAAKIDRTAPFRSMGVDSLMSLELRNRLESSLGLKLSATLLFAFANVASLGEHLLGQVTLPSEGDGTTAHATPAEPTEEATRVRMLEQLTEAEVEALFELRLEALEAHLRA